MMTRNEYLEALARELAHIPAADYHDVMEFYAEYFDEAGPEKEQQVAAELGSPRQLAAQIKAQGAIRDVTESPKDGRKGWKAIWVGAGAVFAAPIALPLALAAVIILFAIVIVVGAVLFAFLVSASAMVLCGVVLLLAAFAAIAVSPPTGIMLLGFSLTTAGIGLLLFIPILALSRLLIRNLALFINKKILKKQTAAMPNQAQA